MPTLTLRELHPAGVFSARIIELIAEEGSQYGPMFKVNLLTPHGPLTMLCSQTYSAGSKLGKLVIAALGELPKALNTELLEGKTVTVVVEHEVKDKATYDRVTNVLPASAANDPFVNQ